MTSTGRPPRAWAVADDGVLWLSEALLDGAGVPAAMGKARGLPIGNLTSQFWANVYLDALDHHVRDELGCGAYLRYMDLWSALHKSIYVEGLVIESGASAGCPQAGSWLLGAAHNVAASQAR